MRVPKPSGEVKLFTRYSPRGRSRRKGMPNAKSGVGVQDETGFWGGTDDSGSALRDDDAARGILRIDQREGSLIQARDFTTELVGVGK